MQFEQSKVFDNWGAKLGFVCAYFVFTTLLFWIFLLLKKMPAGWNYLHIMLITIIITLIGLGVKRLLK